MEGRANTPELKPTDLRGVLKYVPLWRNHTFVIALDGAVMEEDSLANLWLEIAVLRNLNIHVVLIHGIGAQLEALAEERGVAITDARGYGPTDKKTLSLAIEANARVGQQIIQGLTQNGLRCAVINAVRSAERGVIKGKDQLFAGKVDRVDIEFLRQLLEKEIVPVIGPIAHSREGAPLRVNSDLLAAEVARELQASKLIYVFPEPGLTIQDQFRLNISVQEVKEVLEKHPDWIAPNVRSKAEHAVRTIESGTPRAHLIDSRIHDGLLTEIFSKVGIGSMIHSNPYAQIRRARRKDVATIFNITKSAVKTEALRQRTRLSIEKSIQDYLVYEIDDSVIGCVRLSAFARSNTMELGSVYVQSAYQGRNIGKALVDYACDLAKQEGKRKIVALTTQAYGFFKKVCGFVDGELKDLPPALRTAAQTSGRNSKILVKSL